MPTKKTKGFNWSGITDNGDGTFTARNKAARKRLVKEYHQQGLQARFRKIGPNEYLVSAAGARRQRVRSIRPVRSIGARPVQSSGYQYRAPAARRPMTDEEAFRRAIGRRSSAGVRPNLYRGSPAIQANPHYGSLYRPRPAHGPGFLERHSQKTREQQRSPYEVSAEGKTRLRPGYLEYQEHGMTKTVREQPSGFIEKHFPSQERQHALHTARVQRSQRDEQGMRERSTGPSTRVAGEELLARTPKPRPAYREEIHPAARQGITRSPHAGTTQIAEPSRVRRTSELREDTTVEAARQNAGT